MVPAGLQRDWKLFTSTYPIKKLCLPNREEVWSYYDIGPADKDAAADSDPLIMIPGTCGTADIFFYQMDVLASEGKGYRVISVSFPAYQSAREWAFGFELFLDSLKLKKVHLFGSSLGAFLAQYYAQAYPKKVTSLILCNGFLSTNEFADNAPFLACLNLMPTIAIRTLVQNSFPEGGLEIGIKAVNDWVSNTMVEQLDGYDLCGRLTINCTHLTIKDLKLPQEKITILDVMDICMVPVNLRQTLAKAYPNARYTPMKSGGDFPFLSKHSEITMHIELHMRHNTNWKPTQQNVQDPTTPLSGESQMMVNGTFMPPQVEAIPQQVQVIRQKWINPFADPDDAII